MKRRKSYIIQHRRALISPLFTSSTFSTAFARTPNRMVPSPGSATLLLLRRLMQILDSQHLLLKPVGSVTRN